MIRDAKPMDDAERLAEIYNHYVLTDTATFEVEPIGGAMMAQRVAAVQAVDLPWIVATDVLGIIGFAYAAPFHERAAYAHTVPRRSTSTRAHEVADSERPCTPSSCDASRQLRRGRTPQFGPWCL